MGGIPRVALGPDELTRCYNQEDRWRQ
jgi:hypothetical protein